MISKKAGQYSRCAIGKQQLEVVLRAPTPFNVYIAFMKNAKVAFYQFKHKLSNPASFVRT